jgi:MFS family permease
MGWRKVIHELESLSQVKKDLLSILTLLALSILFFANVLFTDQVLVSDNLDRYYPWKGYGDAEPQRAAVNRIWDRVLEEYPQKLVALRMVRRGQLPLWNPYILSGVPLLAIEPARGFFYPVNVIFYLMDPLKGFGYVSFVQLFLAATFMYLYLTSIELRRLSALLGAIVFGFGGYFLGYLSWLGRVDTAMWMPLMFLCVEKLMRGRRRIWAVILALAIGMAGLAGHYGVVVYELTGVGLYSLWRLISLVRNQGVRSMAQRALLLLAAVGVGALLSAVQLIPTYEATQFAERAHRSYEDRLEGRRHPYSLATALIPDIFGNPVDDPSWGRHAFGEHVPGYYAPSNIYAGVLPLVLAVSALAFKRSKYAIFFATLAALSIGIFLDTGVYRVLYYLPVFRFGRQVEAKVIYSFSISVLAALGLNSVLQATDQTQRRLARMIGLALFLTGVFVILAALLVGTVTKSSGMGEDLGLAQQWYLYNISNIFRFLLLTFACSLLFFLLSQGRIKACLFGLLAIILVVADLFYFGWRFNPSQNPASLYPQTDSISFLQADRGVYRVIRGPLSRKVFPPDTLQVYGISDAQGYGPVLLEYYVEFMNLIEDDIAGPRHIYSLRYPASLSSKLLDLLNVKYVITLAEPGEAMAQLEQTDDNIRLVYDGEVKIYENKDVLPRAFVVTNHRVLRDKEQIFAELTSEGFDPGNCVILEEEPEPYAVSADASTGESVADLLEYTPNRVSIEAEMSTNGFLVLADLYYRGWRAFVDGKEQRIHKADYILRAVQLREGRHVVEFVFDPLSFKIGLSVTVLTLLAMGPLLVYSLLRKT